MVASTKVEMTKEQSVNEDEETAGTSSLRNPSGSTLDESASSSMPKLDDKDVPSEQLLISTIADDSTENKSSQGGVQEPKKRCYHLVCAGIVGFFLVMILLVVAVSRKNQENDSAKRHSSSQPQPSSSFRDPIKVLARQVWNDNRVNTAPPFDEYDGCIDHPATVAIMGQALGSNETFQDMAWTMISVFMDERLAEDVERNLLIGPYNNEDYSVPADDDVSQCNTMRIFSKSELEISTWVPVDLALSLTQARIQWLERVGINANKNNGTRYR